MLKFHFEFAKNTIFFHVVEKYVSFGEMTGKLGIALIIIPLLAILENVAIAKAFGMQMNISLLKNHEIKYTLKNQF